MGNMRLPVLFPTRVQRGGDLSRRLSNAVLGLRHPVEVPCNHGQNLRGGRCPPCQAQPHVLTLPKEGTSPFLCECRILQMQGRRCASGKIYCPEIKCTSRAVEM